MPAHQDDDLFFINPDVQHDIDRGRCELTVFATAGDAGLDSSYWKEREEGSRAAYAFMAGVPDEWVRRTITVSGHEMAYETLAGRPEIALIFLRLPDGDGGEGYPRTGHESLQKLWSGDISTIHAVDGSASYSKSALIGTLTALLQTYQPKVVRTHDYVGPFGDGDHSDHHASAYLMLAAHKSYPSPHQVWAFMAYAVSNLPANLSTADSDRKLDAFLAYAPHDPRVCQTRDACLNGGVGPRFSRKYTTGSEVGGRQNVARVATVGASSQNAGTGQQASKAVDDWVGGSPVDPAREWATVGGKAGSWLNLAWGTPHTLAKVVLYDRPNGNDQVAASTLLFGDGSTVSVGSLPNNGSAKVVTFSPRRVTSLRFTVTAVSSATRNVGLAELQAYSTNVAPRASVSASSQNTSTGQQAYKATDGYAAGSPAAPTQEWATVGGKAGSWLRLTWPVPQAIGRAVLYDRPNGNDQITGGRLEFSDGSSVAVPALPNNGAGYTVTFAARSVTSAQLTITSVAPSTVNVGLAEIQLEP